MSIYHTDKQTINGNNHIVNGDYCKVNGNNNIVNGDYCVVKGNNNIINGDYCKVKGNNNIINGDDCKVDGNNNLNRNEEDGLEIVQNNFLNGKSSGTIINGFPLSIKNYHTLECFDGVPYIDGKPLVLVNDVWTFNI